MPLPAWISLLELATLGRLALALVLGAAIGLERELSGKPAGLRTNILICMGSELFTELSVAVGAVAMESGIGGADPSRIAAQIVSGIGFLGAGTIIVLRGHVIGLTTAATIWVVAAIGMSVGFGEYVISVGATVLVLATLVVLGKVEKFIEEPERVTLRVSVEPEGGAVPILTQLLSRREYRVREIGFSREDGAETHIYRMTGHPHVQEDLIRRLEAIATVRSASID